MLPELIERAKAAERAGNWDQALSRYEEAFARLGTEGKAVDAADLLRWIGTVHLQRSALDVAEEVYEASLMIAELNRLGAHEAKALNCLGGLAHMRGDVDLARDLYSRARSRAEELADQRTAAMLEVNLGALANLRGDLAEALDSYSRALARYEMLGDEPNAAHALNNIGMTYLDLGDWEKAEAHFSRSAALADTAGDSLMTGIIELNRVELHLARDEREQAADCCTRSLAMFSRLGAKTGIGEAYKLRGILHREAGDPEKANAHFALALGLAEVGQDRLLQAETQIEWALLLLRRGRHQDGIRYLNRALRLFEELQARRDLIDIRSKLERMEDLYIPAMTQWSGSLFGDDVDIMEHSQRVADYSEDMAKAAGLSGWDLISIRVGALIHDIGKTLIPDEGRDEYRDTGRLHSHGWQQIHTMAGQSLAKQLDFSPVVQAIVRHHHEEFDGSGYPDRLVGDEIPLGARIVAAADAYDRLLTSGSAWGGGCSPAEAIQTLESGAGSIYDPSIVALLARDIEADVAVIAA